MIYRFGLLVVRLALWIYFRRIEVEGLSRVPRSGPVLLVPNHSNALVDPLVIAIQLRRPISLTARNTLAQYPLMGFAMKAFKIIPIHRRQDAASGSDPAKNTEALAECRRRLSQGAALCLFPEGRATPTPI